MKNSVITIGTFDGVHKGHQAILNKVVEAAEKENLKSIVLSFESPVKQVSGLITTTEEKVNLSGPNDASMPKMALEGTTIRQIIRVTAGGPQIRFRLSNQYGECDVEEWKILLI